MFARPQEKEKQQSSPNEQQLFYLVVFEDTVEILE
jgi:hypothetical protein